LRRTAAAVKRLFSRESGTEEALVTASASERQEVRSPAARPARRETDIPLDVLDRAYTPPLTSSKASFRSDGADHQLDQESAFGGDERWNDEDRYTNKSGDPRIGTHRRTYEPAEAGAETRE
jgi:hypothetical protein